jgi:hypothetical protein
VPPEQLTVVRTRVGCTEPVAPPFTLLALNTDRRHLLNWACEREPGGGGVTRSELRVRRFPGSSITTVLW